MYPELSPGDIHIWSCPLDLPRADMEELHSLLSPEERRRAERFRFAEHRHAFIGAHGALRLVLAGYAREAPERLEVGHAPGNKPFLVNGDRLRFNLSHSGGMALIAVNLDREIGVDIELIRPLPDLDGIAERFFAPGERDDLMSLPPAQRERAFFRCWTRKESFVKAIGHGLQYPLDRFRVALLPDRPPAFVDIGGRPAAQTEWSLHDIPPSDEYAAALAVEARDANLRCWSLDAVTELRESTV